MLQSHWNAVPRSEEELACHACLMNDDRYEHTCKKEESNMLDKPKNMVTHPNHYMFFEGVEAISIIARSMTEEGFKGYCMGNMLKYRLRAGEKWNAEEDLKKAEFYKELFQRHRHECISEDI